MKTILVIIITLVPVSGIFAATHSLCGDPPPVVNETLKGELNGKANFLSKFIGNANLKGKIEASRIEIFSKYPNANKVILDHYLLYQTCVILMQDKSLTTKEKLKELRKMNGEFKEASEKKSLE